MSDTQCLSLDAIPASRQQRLEAWLILTGSSKKHLSEIMGVHLSLVGKALSGERPLTYMIEGFRRLGVPEELLPTPVPAGWTSSALRVQERVSQYLEARAA